MSQTRQMVCFLPKEVQKGSWYSYEGDSKLCQGFQISLSASKTGRDRQWQRWNMEECYKKYSCFKSWYRLCYFPYLRKERGFSGLPWHETNLDWWSSNSFSNGFGRDNFESKRSQINCQQDLHSMQCKDWRKSLGIWKSSHVWCSNDDLRNWSLLKAEG